MRKPLTTILVLLALSQGAAAKCQATKIETDINGVRLGDDASTERVLGKVESLPIGANNAPNKQDMPELVLFNRDKTERAVLTRYPGAGGGDFAVIEVRPTGAAKLVGKTLDAERLSTERGVRLGVSEKFVTELLGPCFSRSVSRSGETTLEYDLTDMRHLFLARVNLPNYFGRYRFRVGKLISFEIGSDYP